jgi:hypothetical protein
MTSPFSFPTGEHPTDPSFRVETPEGDIEVSLTAAFIKDGKVVNLRIGDMIITHIPQRKPNDLPPR